MPSSSPPADVPEPDEAAVRALLRDVPDLADAPLRFVARGWDNVVWRVGDGLAARIPVRAQAVELVENEATWGHEVASGFEAQGAAVSSAVRLLPAGRHPYPWLLTRWVEGVRLEDVPPAERGPVAGALAATLPLVHRPAPPDAPLNPFRGVDLADAPLPHETALRQSRELLGPDAARLLEVYDEGRAAPRWEGPRVWCHGDLHPLNLLLRPGPGADGPASRLGVLDLGDLTSGDPAVDLGVLWLAHPEDQREAALATLLPSYDAAVVTRARGWAARFVLAVAGVHPDPFRVTLAHATAQLLGQSPVSTGRSGSEVQPLHDPA